MERLAASGMREKQMNVEMIGPRTDSLASAGWFSWGDHTPETVFSAENNRVRCAACRSGDRLWIDPRATAPAAPARPCQTLPQH
jgi:hypothetical protein